MSEIFKEIDTTFVVYILLIISVIIPLVRPLGLPIPIDDKTREVYEVIETVQSGDYVILSMEITAAQWSDVGPGTIALVNHLMQKGAKLIVTDFLRGDGTLTIENNWDKIQEIGNKEYGVDYVNLGYFPGTETAFSQFARDIKSIASEDVRGRELAQMPIMEEIENMEDVTLAICVSENIPVAIGQWADKFDIKFIGFPNTMGVPTTMPYYTSGSIEAIMQGLSAGSQYEILINRPGIGAATLDAQTLAHLLILALTILGNVEVLRQRGKGET
jgi:hypothetical protein